jgi:hypothetical protein
MVIITIMSVVVIYDSFAHDLPFYYILFFLSGMIIGHFVSFTETVLLLEDGKTMTLRKSWLGIIINVILLVLRFFVGKILLLEFSVVWIMDALYLFFIGIHFSKLKGLIRQVNEHFFNYFYKSEKDR